MFVSQDKITGSVQDCTIFGKQPRRENGVISCTFIATCHLPPALSLPNKPLGKPEISKVYKSSRYLYHLHEVSMFS